MGAVMLWVALVSLAVLVLVQGWQLRQVRRDVATLEAWRAAFLARRAQMQEIRNTPGRELLRARLAERAEGQG